MATSAVCQPGTPLTLKEVSCERVQGASFDDCDDLQDADSFDLNTYEGTGVRYSFDIVGGGISGDAYGPQNSKGSCFGSAKRVGLVVVS